MNNKEIAEAFGLTIGNVKKRITDLKLIGRRVSANRTVPVDYSNVQVVQIIAKDLHFIKTDANSPNLKFALIEHYLSNSEPSVEYYAEVFNISVSNVMVIINSYLIDKSIVVESKLNKLKL